MIVATLASAGHRRRAAEAGRRPAMAGLIARWAGSVMVLGVALLLSAADPAHAYQFGPGALAACPACITPTGQAQAAELAEGLAINGDQSDTFGPTTALVAGAAATSTAAGAGATGVTTSLLLMTPGGAVATAGVWPVAGLAVGAFATGVVVGTAGRAIVMPFFGGDDEPEGATEGQPWTNARWKMCWRDPSCDTILYSSAWSSPVIPRLSVYAEWEDRWSTGTNVSAEHTTGWSNCFGASPPNPPCEAIQYSGWGPQAGEVEGAREVTVYGVGTSERPGHVFTLKLAELLARGPTPSVLDADDATGDRYGEVDPGSFTETELLQALDSVMADNPDFGAWVQDQLAAHPVVPDCTGLSYENCVDLLQAAGLGHVEQHTLLETNLDAGNGEVVDTDPAPGEHVDPETTVRVAVNPETEVRNKEDERCETGEGPQTDPGPAPPDGTAHPQYQTLATFSGIDASDGAPPYPAMTIPLRYGTKQFGLRRIKIRHGYGPSDAAQTRLALETDPAPTQGMWASRKSKNFHHGYTVNLAGGGTLACERTVVVEFAADPQGYFRGVQNSFQGAVVNP